MYATIKKQNDDTAVLWHSVAPFNRIKKKQIFGLLI